MIGPCNSPEKVRLCPGCLLNGLCWSGHSAESPHPGGARWHRPGFLRYFRVVISDSVGLVDSLVNMDDWGLLVVGVVKDGCGPPNAICDPHISIKGHLYTPVPDGRTAIKTGSSCTSWIPTRTPPSPPLHGRGSSGWRNPVCLSSLLTWWSDCFLRLPAIELTPGSRGTCPLQLSKAQFPLYTTRILWSTFAHPRLSSI